ncbi:MAG TPA: sensor histidine kinase [Ktedonobacterales bacterium]|nr:sensor histidine kinase [Ktedonobacterales bacterium]
MRKTATSTNALADMGLAVLVAAGNVVAISVASEPTSRAPDVPAYLLGMLIGAVLVVRRRWPLVVLITSTVLLLVYYSLTYPGIPPAVALSVALYTAVAAGYLRWGLPIAAFFVLAGLFVVVVRKHEPPLLMLAEMAQQAALLAVLLLLGEVVRNRRLYVEEVHKRLRQVEQDREREAARQVMEERLRIARELHDVLAHTITAMSVQAGLALDTLDDSPAQARTALGAIRTASREAMAEIRATIGVLRTGDDGTVPHAPMPGLAHIERLVAESAQAGLHVETTVGGDPRPLPATVEAAAYRIIQESLTNAIRHAQATVATVRITYEPTALGIDISNNVTGAADGSAADGNGRHAGALLDDEHHEGYGLNGMRERATALGGSLQAKPQSDGGFQVRASLPTTGRIAEGTAP